MQHSQTYQHFIDQEGSLGPNLQDNAKSTFQKAIFTVLCINKFESHAEKHKKNLDPILRQALNHGGFQTLCFLRVFWEFRILQLDIFQYAETLLPLPYFSQSFFFFFLFFRVAREPQGMFCEIEFLLPRVVCPLKCNFISIVSVSDQREKLLFVLDL